MNINETNIYQGFSIMLQEHGMSCDTLQHEYSTKGVFNGLAVFLRDCKNIKEAVCLTITDFKGEMLIAAYCKYIAPVDGESDETAGSWLIDYTFNKEDIPENAKITDIKEPACFNAFNVGADMVGYEYKLESDIIIIAIATIKSIVDWLDTNAKETEEVSVEHPGLFTATVVVEKGVKIIGIVVDEELKGITKGAGDDLLSKANVLK